jgi:hypothetical protein
VYPSHLEDQANVMSSPKEGFHSLAMTLLSPVTIPHMFLDHFSIQKTYHRIISNKSDPLVPLIVLWSMPRVQAIMLGEVPK